VTTQYHYAPMTGMLSIVIDGVHQDTGGYEEWRALFEEFTKLRAAGEIKIVDTIMYGHPHFHGHAGRVDVYAGGAA